MDGHPWFCCESMSQKRAGLLVGGEINAKVNDAGPLEETPGWGEDFVVGGDIPARVTKLTLPSVKS